MYRVHHQDYRHLIIPAPPAPPRHPPSPLLLPSLPIIRFSPPVQLLFPSFPGRCCDQLLLVDPEPVICARATRAARVPRLLFFFLGFDLTGVGPGPSHSPCCAGATSGTVAIPTNLISTQRPPVPARNIHSALLTDHCPGKFTNFASPQADHRHSFRFSAVIHSFALLLIPSSASPACYAQLAMALRLHPSPLTCCRTARDTNIHRS